MTPNAFTLFLKYTCECGADHWLKQEEVKGPYTLVCDVCNKRHKIRPIKSAKVLLNFCKTQTPKLENYGNSQLIDEAYSVLKSYGYSKQEIQSAKISADSVGELVREFLSRQK